MLTCPAPAESGFDIYSRVFAPAFGVPEDPVVRFVLSAFSLPSCQTLPRDFDSRSNHVHSFVPLSQTGAAHTALTPFYLGDDGSLSRIHDHTRAKSTQSLRAKQVSKRGGELVVTLDEQKKRVELKGSARRIMKGLIEL